MPAMEKNRPVPTPTLLYESEDGEVRIETRLVNESIWLNLNQLAELFSVDKSGISRHLKNIFETGELSRKETVAIFATVKNEGSKKVSREIEFFNLDAIKRLY